MLKLVALSRISWHKTLKQTAVSLKVPEQSAGGQNKITGASEKEICWFAFHDESRLAVSNFGPDSVTPLSPDRSGADANGHLLCPRHGAFEADPKTGELIHLQSSRHWRRWNNEWYRQHTDGIGLKSTKR